MHNVRPLPNISCRQNIDRDFWTILQNDYDDHENIVVKIANRMYIVVKVYNQLYITSHVHCIKNAFSTVIGYIYE